MFGGTIVQWRYLPTPLPATPIFFLFLKSCFT
jgi:hypothetical protein